VEIQHGFESWRVLNLETRTMSKKAVDRIRASNFSNGFDPMYMRVAEYASSWKIQLVEEGGTLTVTELRPVSIVYSQALLFKHFSLMMQELAARRTKVLSCVQPKTTKTCIAHFSGYLSGLLLVFFMCHLSVRMHRILQATRPVHHTRLCFLVCENLFQKLLLYL
jgi:hypothetical protein